MSNSASPLGVTFGSLSVLGPRGILDVAQQAQALGYQSIWTVEATGTDAFSLLGGVSAVCPTMGLATGIVPIQIRTPALTAMHAATLQAMSPDADIYLGLGVSAPGILRQQTVWYQHTIHRRPGFTFFGYFTAQVKG